MDLNYSPEGFPYNCPIPLDKVRGGNPAFHATLDRVRDPEQWSPAISFASLIIMLYSGTTQ